MVYKFFLFIVFTLNSALYACTGIKLIAKNNAVVHGRTVEFGRPLDISIAVIPRDYHFTGTTLLGRGMSYTSKYGAVGMIAFDQPAILDGINEKGLCVGTFHFPEYAEYGQINPDNQSLALSPIEFPHWILTQFATLEEVRAGLASVIISPTITKSWGTTAPSFHYLVADKQGKCLVIEPVNGQLCVYENRLGTLTNSPGFNWHMAQLRHFIHLKSQKAKSLQSTPFGLSLLGPHITEMPGDFTASARFVRAALLSTYTQPCQTSETAVYHAFHLLNHFDIPVDLSSKEIENNYTAFTCVKDPQTLKYYFKTYADPAIRMVDLTQFDLDISQIKRIRTAETDQPCLAADISSELE